MRDASVLALDAHVRPREERRRHGHESRERDEEDVQRIDEKLLVQRQNRAFGAYPRGEGRGGAESQNAEEAVDLRRVAPMAEERQHGPAGERTEQQHDDLAGHAQSSFSFSRCRVSSVSKRSRISKMKMPRISAATSTSSAMPSSTTIGMPYTAPVAAKKRPFSMARKP